MIDQTGVITGAESKNLYVIQDIVTSEVSNLYYAKNHRHATDLFYASMREHEKALNQSYPGSVPLMVGPMRLVHVGKLTIPAYDYDEELTDDQLDVTLPYIQQLLPSVVVADDQTYYAYKSTLEDK